MHLNKEYNYKYRGVYSLAGDPIKKYTPLQELRLNIQCNTKWKIKPMVVKLFEIAILKRKHTKNIVDHLVKLPIKIHFSP